jgi:hypothetical protein
MEEKEDPDLEMVLSQSWYPDWYGTMVSSRKIDLEDLSKRWSFSPGLDTGIAHIYLPSLDRSFSYTSIQPTGSRSWRFDGAPLQMSLRPNNTLAVTYTENAGALRTVLFVALPMELGDLIVQETERRTALFRNLFALGPAFQSTNYGTLSFFPNGRFTWIGNNILIPQIIPASALGSGAVLMGLFLAPDLEERYTGAFTLRFDSIGNTDIRINFMYTSDDQGIRIEYAPPDNLDGVNVLRRAASPRVIYFFKAGQETPAPVQPMDPLEF